MNAYIRIYDTKEHNFTRSYNANQQQRAAQDWQALDAETHNRFRLVGPCDGFAIVNISTGTAEDEELLPTFETAGEALLYCDQDAVYFGGEPEFEIWTAHNRCPYTGEDTLSLDTLIM